MTGRPDRILTTHAGSLPRPPALTVLYSDRHHGTPIDEAELDRQGRVATRWALDRQREAGIDIPNNGEQVREAFFLYVRRRMSGFGGSWQRPARSDVFAYPEFAETVRQAAATRRTVSNFDPPMAIGPVAHTDPGANLAELTDFKAALAESGHRFADAFMTAPSPGIVALAMKNRHYESEDAYLDALAEALAIEYRAALEHGLILQIDAPDLAMERHFTYADRPLSAFLGFVDKVVARINRMIAGLPRERIRLHVCWGNYEGPHDRDVALADILPNLLQAEVGGFVLPFANPRHQHEIRVLREIRLKPGQILVAGVIDTLTNFVEHPEVVAERLERAAEAVGDPGRVMAATDCGFDTAAGMGRVTADIVWAKLRAMADGAALASRRLF